MGPTPLQSYVCSSFVTSMLQAGGLFEDADGEVINVETAEFSPKDVVEIGFYDMDFDYPAECQEADPNISFCQLLGQYRIDLTGRAGFVEPYDHMDEKCPTYWPGYGRAPGC